MIPETRALFKKKREKTPKKSRKRQKKEKAATPKRRDFSVESSSNDNRTKTVEIKNPAFNGVARPIRRRAARSRR